MERRSCTTGSSETLCYLRRATRAIDERFTRCVRTKRTDINIREYQHKALAELSKRTGATVSELVRRAIDEYLKNRK